MFKSLNPIGLGISGRQSELIELALTYGYRGLEIDFDDFAKRSVKRGAETARRFIDSCKVNFDYFKVSGFPLKMNWQGDEGPYKAALTRLQSDMQFAGPIGVMTAWVDVQPGSDSLPMNQNFDMHMTRLGEIAAVLAEANIKMAVGFKAAADARVGLEFEFIHKAEELLKLVSSIPGDNVGLGLDTWNWQVGGGTLDQLKTLGVEKIVSVRIADLPSGADLAEIPSKDRLLPGDTSEVDNTQLLTWLKESGYEGPVCAYPHASCFSGMTRDNIVQRAAQALEKEWVEAGFEPSTRSLIVDHTIDDDEEIEGLEDTEDEESDDVENSDSNSKPKAASAE